MNYTEGQLKTLDSLGKWYGNRPLIKMDYFFTLQGWSGTGKTTIIKEFIDSLPISKSSIAVTAPTHKAKKVIQNATGFRSETIQSLLGLRPDTSLDNFSANNPIFSPIASDKLGYYKIIIIDESSMLNKQSFKFIIDKAYEKRVRIIFMGDPYQLPPVNEKVSKVFTDITNTSKLDEVVRQDKDNPMYEFINRLREDVILGTDTALQALLKQGESMNNNKGFAKFTNTDFSKAVIEKYLSTEYTVSKDYIKYLAYTNHNITKSALGIRKALLKEESENLVNIGEHLISYNTINDSGNNPLIINSEEYIIKKVEKPFVDENEVLGRYVILENQNSIFSNTSNTIKVFMVDNKNNGKFYELIKTLLANALMDKRQWRNYYRFKNQYVLLGDLTYPDGKKLCKKDIFYGQALTIHKSQGSTYNHVALNLKDIYRQQDIGERSRLIYVGLSRAKDTNIILI